MTSTFSARFFKETYHPPKLKRRSSSPQSQKSTSSVALTPLLAEKPATKTSKPLLYPENQLAPAFQIFARLS